MGKNYYVFRHGETHVTKTKGRYGYGHKVYSATILEEGKPSVTRLANHLKKIETDYNVSSPFLRCRQTAEIVNQITGKEFVFDKRLGEIVFVPPWFFRRRVLSFISEMESSSHENILICTHAAVITVLLNHLTTDGPTSKEKLRAPNPGVLSVIRDGKLEEIDFNE